MSSFERSCADPAEHVYGNADRDPKRLVIALGANQPLNAHKPAQTVAAALQALSEIFQAPRCSGLYRSPAWPDAGDPPFVNAVFVGETGLGPRAVLDLLHDVEAVFERQRRRANAPRTLDLDLVDWSGRIIVPPSGEPTALCLPHPRATQRDFVLVPLCEVWADWRDPQTGKRAAELLAALETVTAVPLK
ncbi:MAG: 2-amino-4-hydroxy-6-hydroxymethyldihydropteridine diphosphokinase [Pseudomonadota bacterium]